VNGALHKYLRPKIIFYLTVILLKSAEIVCLSDREYLEKNLYSINVEAESEESAMVKFYELIARPVQGVCR
jgi:hypothetical protein